MAEIPAGVTYLQFFARREADESYTLCLDSSSASDLPQEIGKGFKSVEAVTKALVDALTAPAVAEERMIAVEDYAPALNAAIDSVNEQGEAMQGLSDRLRELEAWRMEMERQDPSYRPPTRPAVPRVKQKGQMVNPGLRRAAPVQEDFYQENEPEVLSTRKPAPNRSIVGPSVLDEARPDFNRGEFKPHQPVGRVGRGPGSVG